MSNKSAYNNKINPNQSAVAKRFGLFWLGGANGIRTHDLLNAIQTRYQLRYNPINFIFIIQETLPNWQAISAEKLKKISSFRSPTYLRTIKKERNMRSFHGGLSGTRTLGPLIKSQLLYQLS